MQLYELGADATPTPMPATVELLADKMHVVVTPKSGRLAERRATRSSSATSVRDADGKPAGGHADRPLPRGADAGPRRRRAARSRRSTITTPMKLENSRTELAAALDAIGRDHILGAWPFTTMSVSAAARDAPRRARRRSRVGGSGEHVDAKSPGEALLDFPFGIGSILERRQRLLRHDQDRRTSSIRPRARGAPTAARDRGRRVHDDRAEEPRTGPMPVVIFGHGLITERRFVLAVGDALAAKGYAAISIDFPYHGDRTYCATGGPISVVNPLDGSLVSLDPCQSGSTCNDSGQVRRRAGQRQQPRDVRRDLDCRSPRARGSSRSITSRTARITSSRRSIDLGALDRSLRLGNWQAAHRPPRRHLADLLRRPVARRDHGRRLPRHEPRHQARGAQRPGRGPRSRCSTTRRSSPPSSTRSSRASTSTARSSRAGASSRSRTGSWTRSIRSTSARSPARRALMLQMATLDFIIPNANTEMLQSRHRRAAPRLRRRARVPHHPGRARVLPRYVRARGFLSGNFSHEERLDRSSSVSSLTAHAGGLAVGEQNAVSAGTAGAGAARDDDPGAAWHDPGRPRRRRRLARRLLARRARTPRSRRTSDAWHAPTRPRVVRRRRTSTRASRNGRLAAGLAVGVPFGGGITWPATGPGATEAVQTQLMDFRTAPFVAYRFGKLRVAAGVHVDAARLQIARNLDFIDTQGDVTLDMAGRGYGVDASAYYPAAPTSASPSPTAAAPRSTSRATRTSPRPTRSPTRRPTSTRTPR